ncbi:MAG: trypsin-like peptidase domain-containing protein [Planctomycetota bacterium]
MARIRWYGPSVLLLITVVGTLLIGPSLVQRLAFAHTAGQVERVRADLQANGSLINLSDSFKQVAQAVEPSVVHIDISKRSPRFRGLPNSEQQVGNGSGWVYDQRGHIITNNHVVEGADGITVRFVDGSEYEARIVGGDPKTDIAVLKIDTDLVHPAVLAREPVEQGQIVFAFGSPLRYSFSMSQGIVSSAQPRRLGITGRGGYERFIQTDAAINPGNSGGPLTDVLGRVVGMNTAIAAVGSNNPFGSGGSGGFIGIGFAIPADLIRSVADSLIDNGRVDRGYLGVLIADLTDELAQTFEYDGPGGVLVQDILPDGPAQEAGIELGDIIQRINDKAVKSSEDLRYTVSQITPGEAVQVEVFREGKVVTLTLTLGRMPDDGLAQARPRNPFENEQRDADQTPAEVLDRVGLARLREFTPALARRMGVPTLEGIEVRAVRPLSVAARAGLAPGRIITHVNRTRVTTIDELADALREADGPVRIASSVWDRGMSRYFNAFTLLDPTDAPPLPRE